MFVLPPPMPSLIALCGIVLFLVAESLPLQGEVPIRFENPVITDDWPDPTFWFGEDGYWYSVATCLLDVKRSRDFVHWTSAGTKPQTDECKAHLDSFATSRWAPDVIKVGGGWNMYVTQFISSDTNRLVVLTAACPQGPFRFSGIVVENWRYGIKDLGIDAEVVNDGKDLWLFSGSVAGGVFRRRLTADGLRLMPGESFVHVAGLVPKSDDRRWIYSHACYEGSYLYQRKGWWYLFVSAGSIYDGGYHLSVGRAKSVDGVFRDRAGRSLSAGGGTVILSAKKGAADFSGPGHNGEIVMSKSGRTYMFYHALWDACPSDIRRPQGLYRPTLLQEIQWDDEDWPFFEPNMPCTSCVFR